MSIVMFPARIVPAIIGTYLDLLQVFVPAETTKSASLRVRFESGRRDERAVLADGHFARADREWPRQLNFVRLFVRRLHRELSRRNAHQFHANGVGPFLCGRR